MIPVPDKVLVKALRKSKLFQCTVYILHDGVDYFSVIEGNLQVILDSDVYPDKKIYHTILFQNN